MQAVAPIPAPAAQRRAARYYVPVCLYPHTRYRTREGLLDLIRRFELAEADHLLLVADHLLALDRLVTGRYWSRELVFESARRDGAGVFRLIQKTIRRAGAAEHGRLCYWDAVASTVAFRAFRRRLIELCRAEPGFMAEVERFVTQRIERFGMGLDAEREWLAELDYILGELSMSIYCTEVLGYSTEVWERPLAPGAPDPLGLLYGRFPEVVARACGIERPQRRLLFLYEEAEVETPETPAR